MKTSLDCVPCFLRQTLEAARLTSPDPAFHEQVLREALQWAQEMDFSQPPPFMAQYMHRQLRAKTGIADPYQAAKARQNQMALEMLPALRAEVQASDNPLIAAARLAIAGNQIDMGVNGNISEAEVLQAIRNAWSEPLFGEAEGFQQAIGEAKDILYVADNAGEIAFDRLLIEQLLPTHVTLAVRGAPVINDATRADAQAVGLDELVEVIDNGSDAPGTLMDDCNPQFRRRFAEADLIIAKGQGNFETLSSLPGNIFFLFKAKCALVADAIHQPQGTPALVSSSAIAV